jgi:hypothetical protein
MTSGIKPLVAPMPAGMNMSLDELARRSFGGNVRALLAAIESGDAPPLPPGGQRMGGELMFASYAGQQWLKDEAAFRLTEPERLAERNRQARERHELAMRVRDEEAERAAAWSREQRALMQANEAERRQEREERERKNKNRQVVIVGSDGRTYR